MEGVINATVGAALPASRVLTAIQAARLIGNDECAETPSLNTLRWHTSQVLRAALDFETTYGTLSKQMDMGDGFSILYLCPFALLNHLSKLQPALAELMAESIGRSRASIALYIDEVTPGNPFRPDKARSYQAIYWTILQLPTWLRIRENAFGWFTFSYVKSQAAISGFEGPRYCFFVVSAISWPVAPQACDGGHCRI